MMRRELGSLKKNTHTNKAKLIIVIGAIPMNFILFYIYILYILFIYIYFMPYAFIL
jgi:hypothetical protein